MKVITPTIKLDVRIDAVEARDGNLALTGMAGMLPCDMSIRPDELRKLIRLLAKPAVLKLLFVKKGNA